MLGRARVMVIGGVLEGRDDSSADQKLVETCGFILSEKVLEEIGLQVNRGL